MLRKTNSPKVLGPIATKIWLHGPWAAVQLSMVKFHSNPFMYYWATPSITQFTPCLLVVKNPGKWSKIHKRLLQLPITIRSAPSSDTFRRHLKTNLFNNTAID